MEEPAWILEEERKEQLHQARVRREELAQRLVEARRVMKLYQKSSTNASIGAKRLVRRKSVYFRHQC